jgi:predicted nucleic acid-binding Zn ribbon protein
VTGRGDEPDEDSDAAGPGEDPVAVTEALERVLRGLRAGTTRRAVGGVFGRWEETVGPALAAHVRPVRLDRQVLLVEVDDPAWATHLRFLEDDLCRKVGTVTGTTVERLEIRVAGPGSSASR